MRYVLLAAWALVFGGCSGAGDAGPDGAAADAAHRADGGADLTAPADGMSADGPVAGDAGPTDRGVRADAVMDGLGTGDAAGICQQLEADYASLLGRARECNPWTEMNECTKKIPGNLGCPCDTYVNTGKLTELQQLYALTQQWATAGCSPCKTGVCRPVVGGDCEELPSGTSGQCVDRATN